MRIVAGILIGILLVGVLAGIALFTGAFNTAATAPPGRLEEKLATLALDRSIQRRAPRMTNPVSASSDALREGLSHFRANCLMCHGAPGVDPHEFGEGLNPPAPDLTLARVQARPDGQLFWITSEGIRMTGMPAFSPTHSRDEIWKIVAFLRRLPSLSDEEETLLAAGAEEAASHHQGDSEESAPAEASPPAASKPTPHKHSH